MIPMSQSAKSVLIVAASGKVHRVEGSEDAVINAFATPQIPHVVRDYVDHEIHAPCMERGRQVDKVRLSPKVAIHSVDILGPVPMVRRAITATVAHQVLHDGGDPDLLLVSYTQVAERGRKRDLQQ